MSDDVKEFKQQLATLSAKLAKVDRRGNSIANLNHLHKVSANNKGKHFGLVTDNWLPCCRPGIPCSSRIMARIEDNSTNNCKVLVTACGEIKYCLHSTR